MTPLSVVRNVTPSRIGLTGLLVGAAAADAACAAAPSFSVLAAALAALGGLSVVAQIVVPLAATLASPPRRAKSSGR